MRMLRAKNAVAAIAMARAFQRSSQYDLFHGQLRPRPIVPTMMRREGPPLNEARQRLRSFVNWACTAEAVASMIGGTLDLQAVMAVAQHYGLPTSLVDFS